MNPWTRYKEFVRKNGGLIEGLESTLSSLTWLIPDRFQESEVTIEALHSGIGLVSLLHDTIRNEDERSPTKRMRYLPWPFLLAALRQVEVLLEIRAVAAERADPKKNRYGPLIALEAVKAVLKLLIKGGLAQRLLLDNGLALDHTAALQRRQLTRITAAFARLRAQCEADSWRLTDKNDLDDLDEAVPAFLRPYSHSSYWWEKQPSWRLMSRKYSGQLLVDLDHHGLGGGLAEEGHEARMAQRMLQLGELLHVLRPLIYVCLLRRYGTKKWSPWVVSLLVEVTSLLMVSWSGKVLEAESSEAASREKGCPYASGSLSLLHSLARFCWSPDERRELDRRRLMLLAYLLRDPMFNGATKPATGMVRRVIAYIPLLGTLTNKSLDLLEGIQHYYTYTSTS